MEICFWILGFISKSAIQISNSTYRFPNCMHPSEVFIESSSKDVFEPRSLTASGRFAFLGSDFAPVFGQIVCKVSKDT